MGDRDHDKAGPGGSDVSTVDPAARRASVEQKIAAVNHLIPYVMLMPRGAGRAAFEEAIARRLGVSLQALRDEVARRDGSLKADRRDAAAGGWAAGRRRRRQSNGG
jgi:hypothetical protein